MNAVVQFPARAGRDLIQAPAAGYAQITRKVGRIIEDHETHSQAARLTVRAAVVAAAVYVPGKDLAQALRDMADKVEGGR